MPDGTDTILLNIHSGLSDIDPSEWDACVGDQTPFLRYGFLSALEDSGSVTADTGWLPRHITIAGPDERLIACAPLYVKGHSYGEYVFDMAWARAYEQAGGDYYPKLQCSVPFTPATGPRLLIHPDASNQNDLRRALLSGMRQLCRKLELSSVHITFATEAEYRLATETTDYLGRIGQQYHWQNKGYGCFQDFLDALSSRKRKNIRKEREKANSHGVRLRALSGDEIKPEHWDAFHRFYLDTIDRKWSRAYLTREFFELLGERCADSVVLVVGEDETTDETVCGALNFRSHDTLYGRNWGCDSHYGFLHFEACYYRAIDYAIDHGLARVEAGAQGEHKLSRGYEPCPTYSMHWIGDPGLRKAVSRFLEQEREAVTEDIAVLDRYTPFKKG